MMEWSFQQALDDVAANVPGTSLAFLAPLLSMGLSTCYLLVSQKRVAESS